MPDEDDPSSRPWGAAIRAEMRALDDGAVVVGHSVGGTILIHALAEQVPEVRLGAIVLVAAPFVGAGGWPGDEFELPERSRREAATRRAGRPVPRLDDDTAPPAHADLYARAIPQAQLHCCPGAITSWTTTSPRWRPRSKLFDRPNARR